MQTVQAIDRALPILHSGPGCAQKLSENTGSSGYFSPNIFPCTSINEKDNAQRAFISALQTYWSLYYGLRSLTLKQ